jgi:hypothetical protein
MQCLNSITEEPTYEQQELGVTMEILRFEDTESPAPKRKHRSKGLVALGLVAALMGIGTAFASSTITVNGTNQVNLGQGVVTVSGCDTNIGFKPITKLSADATKFQVTDFLIGYDYDPETHAGLIDNVACAGKVLKVTLYKDKVGVPGVDLVKCEDTYNAHSGYAIGGVLKADSAVIIGRVEDHRNAAEYTVKYACDLDGSFYFPADKVTTAQIYWPDQDGFVFNPNSFDHVTIESVDPATSPSLSGGTII